MAPGADEAKRGYGVAKDRYPFAELNICGDDDAGFLVEFTDQVEQKRPFLPLLIRVVPKAKAMCVLPVPAGLYRRGQTWWLTRT